MTGRVIYDNEREKVSRRKLLSLSQMTVNSVHVGQQAKTGKRKFWDLKSQSERLTLGCEESATTTTTQKMLNQFKQFKSAYKMIINIINSHKPISEKRTMWIDGQKLDYCHLSIANMETKRKREFHPKCNTNCQSTNCYLATTIIYILLHLLLIGATSSQATSQIRSTWVSSEDSHHQEQLKPHNLPNDSHLRRPPPPISSERRLDFEEISAGGSEQKQSAAADSANKNEFKVNTGLHASASSLQPVAIEPEATGDYSGKQQVSQRRSSQPMMGDESLSHHSRAPPQFKIAHLSGTATNLSDELASSLEHRWMGQNHGPLASATNMSASVSNAQVHFDEDHNISQVGAFKLYLTDTNDRRQDIFNSTEPTSNLAPKHETFDSQLQYANKTSSRQAHSGNRYGPAYQMPGEGDESDDLIDSLMMDNRTTTTTTTTNRALARGDQPNRQNSTQNARERDFHLHNSPPQMLEQPAIIYLPDGDKWNQPAPEEHSHSGGDKSRHPQDNHPTLLLTDDSRRQRRRPTHGNGDSFVFPQANLDEKFFDATRSKLPDDVITVRPIEPVYWPHGSNTEPHNQPQLSYGFVSSGGQQTLQPSGGHLFHGQQVTTTTPMPTVYPAHFAQDLSSAMKEQIYLSQYANPTTVAPPITNFDLQLPPRRQAQSTIMPQTLHQFIGSGDVHNYLPIAPRGQTLPFNHRAQAANRVINLGEAPQGSQFSASASGPKSSLFRNYSPMQLLGSGKTKKSLLSTINEKFNTWTGTASDSDVRHLIESSFYEQPQSVQTARRRRRPGMTQSGGGSGGGRGSTPRNRNIGQNHILPHGYSLPPLPLLYGPIRQPTVAPAASTLGDFYGEHQTSTGMSYAMSRPAGHHHHQRHQSPGSQQQAANFIPVVAVQVTRTSPAPNALDASSQVDKLGDQYAWPQVSQQSTDSISANEIDEYLASRTGHLSASKQQQQHAASNLNDKQKWDDSFGSSAAATTGQRYENVPHDQQVGSPRARRRNVMNLPTGRQPLSSLLSSPPPQHETTIKSAVFGYLPHQADAPLLQAMNMLQQLPAGQVQHHHHHHSPSHLSSNPQKQTIPTDHNSYSSELYANQMDNSQQSVEAATPPLDYQSLAAVAAAAAAAATASQQQSYQASPFHGVGPDEQPMSLALQLQANNYLQNDIAHPFGSQMSATMQQQRALGGPKHAPLDVIYPSHQQTTSGGLGPGQLHYPAFQFMSPSQLNGYQSQLAQIMGQNSPLLTNQNNNHHPTTSGDDSSTLSRAPHYPFQGYKSKHLELTASDNNLLTTAPNDLNPLLMSPVFYQNSQGALPPTDPFYNFYQLTNGDQHKASSAQVDTDQGTSSGSQDSSSGSGDQSSDQESQTTVAPSENSQRNQGLNSKGKKRSSDFFASAGQLLLSALPLLLAPTLGLMFASSPANPAARFHGSQLGQASGGLPGPFGPGQTHVGQMNGMLDEGLVMNASPAPQLFTPSPPGSQFGGASSTSNYAPDSSLSSLLMDRYNETFNDGDQPATMAPPSTTTTTTIISTGATARPSPNQYYKTTNSLPALTGFRLDGPTRNRSNSSGGQPNRSATSSTTTHRPIAIILTTLGPSPPVASANESTDLNSSASNGGGGGDGGFGRNRTMPTILVLEDDDQEGELGTSNQGELLHSSSSGNQSHGDKRQQDFQEPRRQVSATDGRQQEQLIRRSSSSSQTITTQVPSSSTIMYDIGYEGADFDAQFATLRKNNLHQPSYLTTTTLAPLQLVNERKHNSNYNYVKDKSHYQYDEPPPNPFKQTSELNNKSKNSNLNFANESTPDDSSASNQQSNSKLYPVSSWPPMRRKTVSLITSSGNKTLLDSSDRYADLMAATGVNGNLRNRVSQNSKWHKIGTGSENQRNSGSSVSGPQTVIYDDERSPFVVHRASGRVEVGNQSNLVERNHSSRSNSPLGTGTTTRQQLNKKRLSTLDSFLVESVPPVDSSQPLREHKRRKRDLSTGPLEEPASSNFIGLSGDSSSANLVKPQSKHFKATGQVVRLKNKSRKLLSRVKKRTKRVERRQDTPLAGHYSPPIPTQNGTQLVYSTNRTDSGYMNTQEFSASHNLHHRQQPVNMTTTYELGQPPEETLRRDASKSKSAIVTAMITHVADGDDDRDQDDAGQLEPSGQEDSAGIASHEELREQLLAKKLLLDRVATRTGGAQSASALDELNYQQQSDEQQHDGPPEFNAGGRGRFKPTPVLDYVPHGLDQPLLPVAQQQNFSATRFINNRAATTAGSRNRLRSRNLMSELNEDTKRALAKFGTLLLEDTLEQLPPSGGRNETRRTYQAQSRKRSLSRPKYASSPQSEYSPAIGNDLIVPASAPHSQSTSGQYESHDIGSATERYSTRATQAPLPLSEDTPPGWSRHYPSERANGTLGHYDNRQLARYNQDQVNYTRTPHSASNYSASDEWPRAAHRNDRTLTYQYPHGRGRHQSHTDMGNSRNLSLAELDARYEHFDSARTSGVTQTGASIDSRQQLSADDNYAPPGVGSQAVAFKSPGGGAKQGNGGGQSQDNSSPINKYNSFLMSHLGASGAPNATGPVRNHNTTSGSSPPPGEQLDARYSTYSNYSTVAPAYHQHAHHLDDGHPYHHDHHHSHHMDDRYRDMPPPPAEYPPRDPRTPRNPGAQYPSSDDTGQYNSHYNGSYPPAPPPQPPSPGIGHYSHPDRHISTHRATADYPGSYRDHYQRQPIGGNEQPPLPHHQDDMLRGSPVARNQYSLDNNPSARYYSHLHYNQPPNYAAHHHHHHSSSSTTYAPASSHQAYGERASPPNNNNQHPYHRAENHYGQQHAYDPAAAASRSSESTKAVNDYLKRVQFSDSDRDKLMASYLTCDGLLNDNDHCLERLSCEFSDPQNIEKANKLDRAVSSILLGHILINTYIPKAFKLRLKSASLFGYTQSGKCSKFACSKLTTRQTSNASPLDSPSTPSNDDDAKSNNIDR